MSRASACSLSPTFLPRLGSGRAYALHSRAGLAESASAISGRRHGRLELFAGILAAAALEALDQVDQRHEEGDDDETNDEAEHDNHQRFEQADQ